MMKYPSYENEIALLLNREDVIGVQDFVRIFGNMPMPSVYARIRRLVEDGKLSVVGKGLYLATAKPIYRVEISDWMKRCHAVMIDELVGVDSCIIERKGNLEVEVAKTDVERTVRILRRHFDKVVFRKDVKLLTESPVGYIMVGRMISESPLFVEEGIEVPAPEKEMVDALCRRELDPRFFQRIMEVYPINRNKMLRYASRRGVAEELFSKLQLVDQQRITMFSRVQRYLAQTNVIRAWVFGSFARGEETETSDLDLLVEYDKTTGLSLLNIVRYQLDMEKLIGRKVDLVENGYLKPFAQASAERDKYLCYER